MGVQLPKLRIDLVGQATAHKTAGRGAVFERRVHPKMRDHFEKVRLSTSEESTHPRRVLSGRAEVRQKPVEDSLKSVAELTVADEALELRTQFSACAGVCRVRDTSLASVGETGGPGIAIEQFVDLHRVVHSPCSVMPLAR